MRVGSDWEAAVGGIGRRPVFGVFGYLGLAVAGMALVGIGARTLGSGILAAAGSGEPAAVSDSAAICRELAPVDPYVDDRENGERAVAACVAAFEASPADAELAYLAAASALQAERDPDSVVEYLERAQALGSCDANFLLGESAWYHDRDAERAETAYRLGAACGDSRAAKAIFNASSFAPSSFVSELEALYQGDPDAIASINRMRPMTASFVVGFYTALGEQYNGVDFQTCWAAQNFQGGETLWRLRAAENFDAGNLPESWLYEKVTPYVVGWFFPELGTRALDEIRETNRQAGKADLIRLTAATTCDSLLTSKIAKGIENFARAKKSLLEIVKERRNDVHSVEDLQALVFRHRS